MNYSGQIDYNRTFGSHTIGAKGNASRGILKGSNRFIVKTGYSVQL